MAQLSITRNGRTEGVFYLPDRPVVIGRSDGVEIQLLDSRVSRRHSIIRQSVAGYMIQDLNTKNGTFVNKEAIEKCLLFHGDTIVVGSYSLRFLEEPEEGLDSLDTADISQIKDTDKLRVPKSLEDGPSPRTRTKADPGGPPASQGPADPSRQPDRAERRAGRPPAPGKAETRGAPPRDSRPVPPSPASRRAAARRSASAMDIPSITQVPVIEGLAADESESQRPSLPEVEIVIEDDSD